MDHDDNAQSGLPEVTVRCAQDPDLVIRMLNRHFIDGDETVFTFDARADGLHARVRDVTVAIWDRDGDLAAFLQGLADDFRGWPGQPHLAVQPTRPPSCPPLRRPCRTDLDASSVVIPAGVVGTSITTWAEAGQQLTNLAADVHTFFARP